MKLKEYLAYLENLVNHFPEALEYDVIYAIDEEGNGYNPVYFSPSIGFACDGDCFIEASNFEAEQENYEEPLESNAVCLN